jgi:hypothetical protein
MTLQYVLDVVSARVSASYRQYDRGEIGAAAYNYIVSVVDAYVGGGLYGSSTSESVRNVTIAAIIGAAFKYLSTQVQNTLSSGPPAKASPASPKPPPAPVEPAQVAQAPGASKGNSWTRAKAEALIDTSENVAGPGSNVGHTRAHVPSEGTDPIQLSQARPNKANTTVYRSGRHGAQDLRDALNHYADEIAQLPADGTTTTGGSFKLSTIRQGYNSQKGAAPSEVSWGHVTIRVAKMPDGRLHLVHFSPSTGN